MVLMSDIGNPAWKTSNWATECPDRGVHILLDHQICVTHTKHWTVWTSIVTDVMDCGIPWMAHLEKRRRIPDDLNIKRRPRVATALTGVSLICLASSGSRLEPFRRLRPGLGRANKESPRARPILKTREHVRPEPFHTDCVVSVEPVRFVIPCLRQTRRELPPPLPRAGPAAAFPN